jgi:AraC-like DNA-binding protein
VQDKDGRIVDLILMEIAWDRSNFLAMRQPSDKRIERMYRHLLSEPQSALSLEAWAGKLNISVRTINRLLKEETGVSFICWRQQIRLLSALPRLALGEPVIDVALSVGYETPGAFSAMFRKFTGKTPAKYFN